MQCQYETWRGGTDWRCSKSATYTLEIAPKGTARSERQRLYICTLHKNRYDKRLLDEAWIVTEKPIAIGQGNYRLGLGG